MIYIFLKLRCAKNNSLCDAVDKYTSPPVIVRSLLGIGHYIIYGGRREKGGRGSGVFRVLQGALFFLLKK